MAKRQIASTGEYVDDKKASAKPKKAEELILHIKVHSPFKVYFEEEAESISAENKTGPFDILPKHHNFITLLDPCDLIIRKKDQETKIRIARGIMHVRDNFVNVFLDV